MQTQYGRLRIIKEFPSIRVTSKNGIVRSRKNVVCLCDCGNTIEVDIQRIKSGNTKSCGCLRKEIASKTKGTHRMSKTVEYSTWCKMIVRCYTEDCRDYRWYGAVGITVCRRWRHSFENFFVDMGFRPSNKHSIERRNSKKNYTPANCYWATQEIQIRNTKQIVWIIYNRKKRKLIEVCEELELKPSTIRERLLKGTHRGNLFSPIRYRSPNKSKL